MYSSPGDADRHRLQAPVEHVDAGVGDGPADGDAGPDLGDAARAVDADRGLGGAVEVPAARPQRACRSRAPARRGRASPPQSALEVGLAGPPRVQQHPPGRPACACMHRRPGSSSEGAQRRGIAAPRRRLAITSVAAGHERQEELEAGDVEGDEWSPRAAVSVASRPGSRAIERQEVGQRAVRDLRRPWAGRWSRRCRSRRRGLSARRVVARSRASLPGRPSSRHDGRGVHRRAARRQTGVPVTSTAGRRVLEHEGEALARVAGVERHVGAARLEDAEQRHDQVERALQAERHQRVGADAQVRADAGQPVGARARARRR